MKNLLLAILAVVVSSPLHAENFLCPEMPSAVTSVNRDVTTEISVAAGSVGKVKAGEVTVKSEVVAKNLFEKFPNADKALTLQILAATYCSMLQKADLSDKDRLSRWEKFQNGILHIGNQDRGAAKKEKLSFSDRLLLDENPTKLAISKVVLERWVGDTEPYVTLEIANVSKRSAVGVKPYFSGDKRWTFEPTRTSSLFRTGVLIEPGSLTQYPVAPLTAFVSKIHPPCQSCALVGVGLSPNPSDDVAKAACGDLNGPGPCISSVVSVPFAINLEYQSIFEQKESQLIAAFAYFKAL